MPRILTHLHDIDAIEELEELEDWEEQIGLRGADARREVRDSAEARSRGQGDRRLVRLGAADAIDRKRAERRKSFGRANRRV